MHRGEAERTVFIEDGYLRERSDNPHPIVALPRNKRA